MRFLHPMRWLTVVAALALPSGLRAEEPEPVAPIRTEPAILPVISGNSDIGFLFGAIGIVGHFNPAYDPYRFKGYGLFAMSVKEEDGNTTFPQLMAVVRMDFPGLFHPRFRFQPAFGYQRTSNLGYFGLGNASQVDNDNVPGLPLHRRNQYVKASPFVELNTRTTLTPLFYFLGGVFFEYAQITHFDDSKLQEDAPQLDGADSHPNLRFQLALEADSRDSELVPIRGQLTSIALRGSPAAHQWAAVTLSTRFYAPLASHYLSLAVRLVADILVGEVPVYELSQMGAFGRFGFAGMTGIRGVPEGRYHGKAKVLGSIELRSMFVKFAISKARFQLGVAAALDAGRVWAELSPNPELDGPAPGLKYGVGGGPRIQWGETMLIRFDFMYSPDAGDYDPDMPIGIYMDMAHAF